MSVTQLLGPCLLTGSFLSHDTIECGPQSCFWELNPLWKQRLLRGPPKSQLCSLKQDRLQAAFPVCGSWHAVCMCECSTLPGHGLSACAPFRQSDPVRLTGGVSPGIGWKPGATTVPPSPRMRLSMPQTGGIRGSRGEAMCSKAAWKGRAKF